MVIEPATGQHTDKDREPVRDRTMLALQYVTALVAGLAAGFLGFLR
jgi:hypothetical protein